MLETIVIAQGGGGVGGFLVQLAPLILIFLIFYFLLIRPEQKKREQHQAFLKDLKVGDRVVTAGGLFGEVTSVGKDGKTVKVKVGRNKPVRVLREQIKGPRSDYLGGDEDED